MPDFIKGFALSEEFYKTAAEPILRAHFPALRYSAGLLGYGSDVLGYDDPVSTDHMWGPRFYLFLKDLSQKQAVYDCLCAHLPCTFRGYSVNFSLPDPQDGGVRCAEYISQGPVSPLIFIESFSDFLKEYLGTDNLEQLADSDWLSFSEHRLLALSRGRFYRDDLNLSAQLEKLRFYPDSVWYYLLASCWSLICEEQAFVKRCSMAGDDLGSRLVCARIAERLMRLAFLYRRRYAPYSKWFGTAFGELDLPELQALLARALEAADPLLREESIALAQKYVADLHDSLRITPPMELGIQSYFGRDIQVIRPEKIVSALLEKCPGYQHHPLIGSLSQVANFTALSDHPKHKDRIKHLYCVAI